MTRAATINVSPAVVARLTIANDSEHRVALSFIDGILALGEPEPTSSIGIALDKLIDAICAYESAVWYPASYAYHSDGEVLGSDDELMALGDEAEARRLGVDIETVRQRRLQAEWSSCA